MKATLGAVAIAVVALAGCDQTARQGPSAVPGPAPAAAVSPDLPVQAGTRYAEFAVALDGRYSPDALGLNAIDRTRLWRAMADSQSGLVTGGGAEALVFEGCAEAGCGEGVAVVAVDTATGGVFVGVVDAGGRDVMISNDRVEALLRLNSPTRSWHDAEMPAPAASPPPEAAPP